MDSDESRPGSSASNSSSSSSNSNSNDGASSPRKSRSKTRSKSPASRASSSGSSRDGSAPKSPVNGVASRSSSADKSVRSASPSETRSRSASKESNRSAASSGDESTGHRRTHRSVSRNQSISPARKSNTKSSRGSSVSSVSSEEHFKTDEISDGEMEQEEGKRAANGTVDDDASAKLNMSHEDLSDVSDLDSPGSPRTKSAPAKVAEPENNAEIIEKEVEEPTDDIDEEDLGDKGAITDLRQKLDERKNQQKNDKPEDASPSRGSSPAKLAEKKNDEDALDFEAEEGECQDPVPEETYEKPAEKEAVKAKKDSDGEVEEGEELEEGEVSDEDEKRPEETEPKPVCRFYTRGQCTWGMSCRFLHPGVTDKGNYTMFDMIRPVPHSIPYGRPEHMERLPPGFHPGDFRNDRPAMHHPMPPVHHPAFAAPAHVRLPPAAEPPGESAWERGLRTAKEMMRKAIKRKEQDMDFEDKKMNLSAAQDDMEKDNYYIRDRASPEHPPPSYPIVPRGAHYDSPPHAKYPPRPLLPLMPVGGGPPPFDDDPYSRARYRELPAHRMPQYEDEILAKQRRIRPTREVIVQRAEPVGRGDEWNDPWMRSKSPGREKRGRRDRRSYSSNSSYSSSSSTSRSDSSSNTSRSPSPGSRRARYNSGGAHSGGGHNKSPAPQRRHGKRSPSPPKRRVHSPEFEPTPAPTPLLVGNFEPKIEYRNHVIVSTNKRPSLATLGHEPNKPKSNPFDRKVFEASVTIVSKHSKPPVEARRSPPPTANMQRKRIASPPPVDKRRGSPSIKRKRNSTPPPSRKPGPPPPTDKGRKKRRSSSSGSGSSDSSGSDSGSSYSSSTSSSSRPGTSGRRGDKHATDRKTSSAGKKVETKKQDNGKSASTSSSAGAAASSSASAASKKTTRREELLKQLRAVEDAIARKRQKLP